MTVAELIACLKTFNPEMEVQLEDSSGREDIDKIAEEDGKIILQSEYA